MAGKQVPMSVFTLAFAALGWAGIGLAAYLVCVWLGGAEHRSKRR